MVYGKVHHEDEKYTINIHNYERLIEVNKLLFSFALLH